MTTKFRDRTSFSALDVDCALCAFDEMLQLRWDEKQSEMAESGDVDFPEHVIALNKWWDGLGTGGMRSVAIQAGAICNAVYQHMQAQNWEFLGAFDFEITPDVLKRLDWDALCNDNQYSGKPYEPAPGPIFDAMVAEEAERQPDPEKRCFRDCWMDKARSAAKTLWAYPELLDDHAERVAAAKASGENPKEFVQWLGEKYDLIPAKSWEYGG